MTSITLVYLDDKFLQLDDVPGVPLVLLASPGEKLTITGEPDSVARAMTSLTRYPALVPEDDPRAVEFFERRAEATRQLAALMAEDTRKAEAWLAEHDVPDYVVDYLRDHDLD